MFEVLVALESANQGSFFAYEPIEWFVHRDVASTGDYITFTTERNRTISISAKHLLPTAECSMMKNAAEFTDLVEASQFAYKVKVGSCAIVQQGAQWTAERIVKITHERKVGIMSPITRSGTLVVDGIVVSTFSTVESHTFQREVFKRFFIYRNLYRSFVTSIVGAWNTASMQEHLPVVVKAGISIASSIF